MSRREIQELLVALGVLLVLRLFVIGISPDGLGSSDLRAWTGITRLLLEGKNPYVLTDRLNWPPFWMQILYVLGRLSAALGVDFVLVLKLFLVAVESVLVTVLYLVAGRLIGVNRPLLVVVLTICVNPVALLLTVQHCNFDVIVGLWVLLFFWAIARFAESGEERYWLLGTMFLGVAIWTKTVPLCLAPVALYGFRGLSKPTRFVGLFLIVAPVTIAMSVIYVLAPDAVTRHVLEYRSYAGFFGVSGLLVLLGLDQFTGAAGTLFTIAFLGALAYAGAFFHRLDSLSRSTLLGVVLLILLAVPVLGPGYAPQYAYWFLPLLALYHHGATPRTRSLLVALHVVMVPTYVIEYALFPSHGSFLQYLVDNETVVRLAETLSTETGQTLVRLPLFVLYLALMAAIVRPLRSARRG